ncbi:peptide chain release factor 1 [Candidatus Curtissbacteria bacterium]|nr:peptide chain release factor 1 [Candidatus Curtissbacteria bacterium]
MNTYLKQQISDLDEKIAEVEKLLADPDMEHLAREELEKLREQKSALEKSMNHEPSTPSADAMSTNSAILEIRAAAGGEEAGLFAADLARMYTKYAASQKWAVEELDKNAGGIGNIKEVIYKISGRDVFEKLKYESGVHRVQRVPKTESSGRIHTSTATVAVLPQVAPTQVTISPQDIEFEAFRSGGHGGQNVNKVSTAVRIRHLPSGIIVKAQTERSQGQNREIAMQILRSKIFQMEEEKRQAELAGARSSQLGTGDRSEKIRTYNFPQNRLTDHRINKSWHDLDAIMEGNLGKVIESIGDFASPT